MSNMQSPIDFVKSQFEFHSRQALRYADTPRRQELHNRTASSFAELSNYLIGLEKKASLAPPEQSKTQPKLALSWEEVKDLPEELIAELSVSDGDKIEFIILSIISEAGGAASLDRLLVEIYKRTGEIMKRQTITNRLYRMGQKDMVFSVPGKKGIYSAQPLKEEEAANLV